MEGEKPVFLECQKTLCKKNTEQGAQRAITAPGVFKCGDCIEFEIFPLYFSGKGLWNILHCRFCEKEYTPWAQVEPRGKPLVGSIGNHQSNIGRHITATLDQARRSMGEVIDTIGAPAFPGEPRLATQLSSCQGVEQGSSLGDQSLICLTCQTMYRDCQ